VVEPSAVDPDLVVAAGGDWRAWCPAASSWPFELLIAPLETVPDLVDERCDRDGLAAVLVDALARLDQVFDAPMPYMMWIHQRPTDGGRWPGARIHLHDPVRPGDWVSELSRYDAAWVHILPSRNHGDLRRAVWNDLNLPARLGTYAAAGLPWIHLRNEGHRVAARSLAERLGVGVTYDTEEELAVRLSAEIASRSHTKAAIRSRPELSFDHHTVALTEFFRGLR
jgi:hypothetical protein